MLPGYEDWMIRFGSGILEAGPDVLCLKVWVILKDFRFTRPSSKKVEHILHPDAHAPDARPPPTLLWIESDPFHDFATIGYDCCQVKGAYPLTASFSRSARVVS